MIPHKIKTVISDALRINECVLLGIDGDAGAGKTRLAIDLLEQFDGSLVKLDHFYLPISKRDEVDGPVYAGHMDLGRLRKDVLVPLSQGQAGRYQVFNCHMQAYTDQRPFHASGLVIIEGSYSLHPLLWPFYHLTLFLTVSEKEQRRRLQIREGTYYEMFEKEWLPCERAYHHALKPKTKAQFVLDTTSWQETVLYLVRHGVTNNNISRIIQGHKDIELSDEGRRQAKHLARRLADYPFDQGFSSDLVRAAETALIALDNKSTPLTLTPLLREIQMGEMEGLTYEECFIQYKDTMAAMKHTPLDVVAPGGETGTDVLNRATAFLGEAIALNPNRVLLAVSHGYILNLLVQSLAKDVGLALSPTIFNNTSLTKLVFTNGQLTDVPLLNNTIHLDAH